MSKTIDEFFGKYLKTEDISQETVVAIKEIKSENLGRDDNKEEKLVVYFNEFEKGLVLNKVNAEALAEIATTREFEKWIGIKCILYVDPNVMFGSKRVGGIRIKPATVSPKTTEIKPKESQ